MPERIPHTDLVKITGQKKTTDYLKMQQAMGKFYFRDFFSKFDKIRNNGRFLEVGPGPGFQTVLVAERYNPSEIIGLEYSSDMIKVAEDYCVEKQMSDKIKYVNGGVENTSLIESLQKFDTIYSTFSLHHWLNPEKGIKNLYGALNDKGVLFIYDFYRGGLLYYLNLKRGVWESIRASYTPDEISQMLVCLGTKNYTIRKSGLYMDLLIRKE